MMRHSTKLWTRAGVLAALAIAGSIAAAPSVVGQSNTGPKYAPNGNLLAPTGFETWVFVGSNLGLVYKDELPAMTAEEAKRADAQMFHNIYLNPEAYAHFRRTREFPDRTVLVMEIFTAAAKDTKGGVLSAGFYDGDKAGMMAAVKNLHRPDGKKTPWAYYIFTDQHDPSKTVSSAAAMPDEKCENCHKLHASKDHVWVQFYPVLRKLLGP